MNFDDITKKINLFVDLHNQKLLALITVFVITFIVIYLVKWIVSLISSKFDFFIKSNIDNIVNDQINKISPSLILYSSFYIAINFIGERNSYKELLRIFDIFFYLGWTIQLIQFINKINIEITGRLVIRVTDKSLISVYSFLSIFLRALTVILGILFILSNLGFDVNTFIAGLGIGGIAIALALQNILKDLFSSLLIIFDKPIRINDYIVTGDVNGVVKEIGIRSTRVETDEGSEIIIPNGDLVNRTIKNYKSRKFQKVVLSLLIKSNSKADVIMKDLINIFKESSEIQESSISIFLIERNSNNLKFKISFSLVKVESKQLPIKLEKLMDNICTLILEQRHDLETLTLENPKI